MPPSHMEQRRSRGACSGLAHFQKGERGGRARGDCSENSCGLGVSGRCGSEGHARPAVRRRALLVVRSSQARTPSRWRHPRHISVDHCRILTPVHTLSSSSCLPRRDSTSTPASKRSRSSSHIQASSRFGTSLVGRNAVRARAGVRVALERLTRRVRGGNTGGSYAPQPAYATRVVSGWRRRLICQ
jgi:hypothetical protein